ncbi:MAG: DUF4843 domain-containing protein [Chitinophagaceae bacterium]|nr:DUF4843 domain-containing protein [Chitinophagaceae bacterium]
MKKIFTNTIFTGTLAAFVLLTSCKKEGIGTYGSNRYVQFVSGIRDSVSLSFFYHPGKDEVKLAMPVKLLGPLLTEDQAYQLEAMPAEGDATTANYSLQTQVFKKGVVKDTAWVTLKKTPELDTKDLRLVLKVTGNKELTPGQTDNIYKVIRITAKVSKPSWWDSNMDIYYMGRYSEKKFRLFMDVTGVGDLTPYDNNQRLIYMLQFKYYLIEQKTNGTPVFMEDGADMLSTVPLLG